MLLSPEPGQIVETRRRYWVVSEVESSSLEADKGSDQHVVTLNSVEEDALGEELQVLWELELGARIVEKAGLPEIAGCDDPEHLDAFLDAVRWGAATSADRKFPQAPFRSGVSIEDYQLDPLVRAVDMARVNLLVADDVGLGKTIEAGLVVQELLSRHRARTVFIVCPASLQVKWQTEMREKFGLEFRIVDTEYIRTLRRERGLHANAWTSYPRLIASMDWMKGGEALRSLKDVLPVHASYPRKFDILILDEAHNVAPSGTGQYAVESQRTRLIRTIAPHFEHRLFLTATPHNGYRESFTSLLELLDDQRFARNVEPDRSQLQRVMVRRLKSELVDKDGNAIYPKRVLLPLEVDYSQDEREAHAKLSEYTKRRTRSVKGTASEYGTTFVLKLLKKRLFSSPMAFATTLEKHLESISSGKKVTDKTLDQKILHKAIQRTEEDYADDARYEEVLSEVVTEASASLAVVTPEERRLLDDLQGWGNATKNRADSKAKAILRWLEAHLRPDGVWNERRVILFTEYRATHSWLKQILASNGFGGERSIDLLGGQDPEERERFKAAFQAHPDVSPVRILLATDAASEGIDLQNHCNYMIHVEIPWNPNVMEQRNGRIDRHGQKRSEVMIWHPVGQGFRASDTARTDRGTLEGDNEYLMRAVMKVDAIRQDLGSVGPVIAQQIEEAMLGNRVYLDTNEIEKKAAGARRYTSVETAIQKRVEMLHMRLSDARDEIHLTPERIARAVRVALELENVPALQPTTLVGSPDVTVYTVPIMPGAWGRATVGLEHPHTGVRRPITFDHAVAKGRDDVVLAHVNHPLVRKCLQLLRAEIWAKADRKSLHRVTVRVVPEGALQTPIDGPIVCVKSRLLVTGGSHQRLHEETTMAGGDLRHGGFARTPRLGLFEELEVYSKPTKPSDALFAILRERFEQSAAAILNAANARSRVRLGFVRSTLENRKVQESDDVKQVLDDLERAIRNELEQPAAEQLSLWPELERNQRNRDLDALRARLERLPQERIEETRAVEQRYADLRDHTFPVAVIFYVPEKLL